jgi:molybdopterin-guanine dinucleotide biosynthesis protein MobB
MTPPRQIRPLNPAGPGAAPRAIAFVGFANSGKTGLICRLLPQFTARGLRVAVLKHSHHDDLDGADQGKDTWRYRRAGAHATALAAPGLLQITSLVAGEPPLPRALARLAADADLVLVEGYKTGPLPKVAVLGADAGEEAPDYPNLIALVAPRPVNTPLPVFGPQQVEELGDWLYDYLSRL